MAYEVLYNFISPVTGRILCDPTMVLVGDARGIAIPSPFIPIGALPDLPMGNIWIGNDMNRPIPSPIITIDNLPNLTAGKIWVGDALTNRPIESTIPTGPPGPPGTETPPSNVAGDVAADTISQFVKYGLEQLAKQGVNAASSSVKAFLGAFMAANTVISLADTVIDGVREGRLWAAKDKPNDYVDYRTFNATKNSLIGIRGAEGLSGLTTLFIVANLSLKGGRLEDISPSPQGDYDAIPAKWVWDLLNDNVEILWQQDLT